MLNNDMILANTFEDPFGDEFGQGVWKELDRTVSSNIQANTVALASFDGKVVTLCCCLIFILLPLFICLYLYGKRNMLYAREREGFLYVVFFSLNGTVVQLF